MKEAPIRIINCLIDDTMYIVESTFSSSARETVCEKVKRLILGSTHEQELKMVS